MAPRGPAGAQQRPDAVPGEERDARPAHDVDGPPRALDDGADAGHAGEDEHQVGDGADRHHRPDVAPREALPQHEGVLGADGDDEAQTREESGNDGGGHDHDARPGATVKTNETSCMV